METKLRITGGEPEVDDDAEGDVAGVRDAAAVGAVPAVTGAAPPGSRPVLAMPGPATTPAPAIPAPERNLRRLILK